MGQMFRLAESNGLPLIADACHALGAIYEGDPIGAIADVTTFSTHSVKHIATGEGGVVTTDRIDLASEMRRFRNHGINLDHHERGNRDAWHYEINKLGYNYRLTDIQCALGISQLGRLDGFIGRRREIAARYDEAFGGCSALRPIGRAPNRDHVYHLYVIRLNLSKLTTGRSEVFCGSSGRGNRRQRSLHPGSPTSLLSDAVWNPTRKLSGSRTRLRRNSHASDFSGHE